MSSNCASIRGERPLLGLISFQVFRTSPCMTYFVSMMMGLGPRFQVLGFMFSLIRLPIVQSTLWGVVFCFDFGPFCFLLLFPCGVLFLYLFLLMIATLATKKKFLNKKLWY
jgi:hypothetical protein